MESLFETVRKRKDLEVACSRFTDDGKSTSEVLRMMMIGEIGRS